MFSADPRTNPRPVWSASHFATVAARTGLEAEVRLAGDAVRIAQPPPRTWSPSDRPASTTVRVSEDRVAGIGGVRRDLGDLTEVADGTPELIYLG